MTGSRSHVIAELGLDVLRAGRTVEGSARVFAEACYPGTHDVRTSVLATWADVVAGTVAGHAIAPLIPLTLDLELHRLLPSDGVAAITVHAEPVKVGRTVVVCQTTFTDAADGRPLAHSFASFIASPDPEHRFEGGFPDPVPFDGRLAVPLAERVERRIVEPGIVEMPRRKDGLNATGAIQGGLVALAAEEALLSLPGSPVGLRSLNVRYLRPFTIGPARAVASAHGTAGVVRLTDLGTQKLGALATAQLELPADR